MKKNLLWVGMLLALILTIPAMAAAASKTPGVTDTEVGYVGRDVDSIVRDLMEVSA